MAKYFLKIAYDGTHFGGWQIQPNAPTIQEAVQQALRILLKKETPVTGQGRTDSGVHALGQAAHFETAEPLELSRFLRSANALLPPAIRLLEVKPVLEEFHARFSSISKTYHYNLATAEVLLPFDRPYRTHFRALVDRHAMRKAAYLFVGTNDFTSFSNEAHRGSCSHDPIRTLKRVDVIDEPDGLRIELEGDGFLYKMCRNIVGTLLDAGQGKLTCDDVKALFAAKDRKKGSTAAPPQGLFLMHVEYPQRFFQM
jgi:tRNA pseudouridine38-40 synthase